MEMWNQMSQRSRYTHSLQDPYLHSFIEIDFIGSQGCLSPRNSILFSDFVVQLLARTTRSFQSGEHILDYKYEVGCLKRGQADGCHVFDNAVAPLFPMMVNPPALVAPATAGKPAVPSSPAIRMLLARSAICG
jgi:hypothetical protein